MEAKWAVPKMDLNESPFDGFNHAGLRVAVMAYTVMAYTVMACTVMTCIIMAYTVMAYTVMAYTVMACIDEGTRFYAYSAGGFDWSTASVTEQYLLTLYWSVTTVTTVGYGDVLPASHGERIYVIAAMLVGGAFHGAVIAIIGHN